MRHLWLTLLLSLSPAVAVLQPGATSANEPANEPFACNIGALSKSERMRQAELSRQLLAGVRAKRELADGYALELSPALWLPAARWADLERRCCPFFAFELAAAGHGGPLWLRITGLPGAKAFMHNELGL